MWKAAGGDRSNRPVIWLSLPSTIKFLNALAKQLKVKKSDLLKTIPGRYGGTYGHYQIALAYAKYLDPELHIWCNEVVKDRFILMADPDRELPRHGCACHMFNDLCRVNLIRGRQFIQMPGRVGHRV